MEPTSNGRGWRLFRYFAVMVSATILATLAINAGDNVHDLSATLIGNLIGQRETPGRCPKGMTAIDGASGSFCIDTYDASADPNCPFPDPQGQGETRANLEAPQCQPRSTVGVYPWTNISQNQAATACAKAGKRLPTNKEWYEAALGTPDPGDTPNDADCYVNKRSASHAALTGGRDRCVSAAGVSDMIGNVWQWIDATVYDGIYNDHKLPTEGYVKSVDREGVPAETTASGPDVNYAGDYFWHDPTGTRGMFRGGYWGINTEAGVYAVHAVVPPSFTGNAVGFRCVK